MHASQIRIVDHPLLRHKLGLLRSQRTQTADFRRLLREAGMLLAYEVTRDLPLQPRPIVTPLEPMEADRIAPDGLCFVSILRAGNGLLEGMIDILPFAPVGHFGVYRDHETHQAVEYFYQVPGDLASRRVIVVDPMLATGNSAVATLDRLKADGARSLTLVCLVAAPEGVAAIASAHPDVEIIAAALDRGLDENAYIVPGLGDAGDRLFGTG